MFIGILFYPKQLKAETGNGYSGCMAWVTQNSLGLKWVKRGLIGVLMGIPPKKGEPENLQVKPETPVFQIKNIMFYTLCNGCPPAIRSPVPSRSLGSCFTQNSSRLKWVMGLRETVGFTGVDQRPSPVSTDHGVLISILKSSPRDQLSMY